MEKTIIQIPEMKLVGITARTSNAKETNPATASIPATIGRFMALRLAEKISNLLNPDRVICAYTNYVSDFNGEYTYFIGKEVSNIEDTVAGAEPLVIPVQTYVKFTTDSGKMPKVCVEAWIKIWQMSEEELGGKRTYLTDFEAYDSRASDPESTILDIYIGIEK